MRKNINTNFKSLVIIIVDIKIKSITKIVFISKLF